MEMFTSLVTAKMKVALIKRLTIPRLELCGAHLLAQLLDHIKEVFHLSFRDIYAWTDSIIFLRWLSGSPRRFKTFVGNQVASIVEHTPPDRWNHVNGTENPADCASRGLFPSELLEHELWWKAPLGSNVYHQSGSNNRISLPLSHLMKGHLPIDYCSTKIAYHPTGSLLKLYQTQACYCMDISVHHS